MTYIAMVRDRDYAWMAKVPVPVSEKSHKDYGVSTTPTVVLVDRDGLVRLYDPGQMKEDNRAAGSASWSRAARRDRRRVPGLACAANRPKRRASRWRPNVRADLLKALTAHFEAEIQRALEFLPRRRPARPRAARRRPRPLRPGRAGRGRDDAGQARGRRRRDPRTRVGARRPGPGPSAGNTPRGCRGCATGRTAPPRPAARR